MIHQRLVDLRGGHLLPSGVNHLFQPPCQRQLAGTVEDALVPHAEPAVTEGRLVAEGGIAPERIELIPNFFDERRFPPRPPLPPKPRKALAFGNAFTEVTDLPVLREACRRSGIELDAAGIAVGRPETAPGPLVAGYDVVFAKARAAIEAMAVGAAVVLCGYGNSGPMVTAREFDSLRLFNFGWKTLSRPLDPDVLHAELKRYDPRDAAEVSRLTRLACGLGPAADRILQLYSQVVEEARRLPPPSPDDLCRAASRYLEQWAFHYKHERESDPRVARLERNLASLRNSATWRWGRRVLANPVVSALLGPFIRATARRASAHPTAPSSPGT
jgi:hypothetical protein